MTARLGVLTLRLESLYKLYDPKQKDELRWSLHVPILPLTKT